MIITKKYVLDNIYAVMRHYQPYTQDNEDLPKAILFNYLVQHTRLHDNANANYILPIVQQKMYDLNKDLPEIYARIREEIKLLKIDRIL